MAKLPKERQTEISVEDLLRLKRSERPSDQFWNEFDRELHQRMLQTLVKKDPWYLQVVRGFSGRILQSTAIAAAAAVVAMVVVRPAFQPTRAVHVAQASVPETVGAPVEVAVTELSLAEATSLPDYQTDVISAEETSSDVNFVRDFGMDSMQVASYDASAYSTDSPQARVSFASAGVASLVY
jgi:negative regulator of sigma E activity